MRIRFTYSALLALCCCGLLSACASAPDDTLPRAKAPPRANARLQPNASLTANAPLEVDGLRLAGSGTGFFIGPDSVLTNFHVVAECAALTVGNNHDGMEVAAKFVAGDPEADLAVIAASAPDTTPAQFRIEVNTDTAQTWAIVGYPVRGRPVLQAEFDRVWIDPLDFLDDHKLFSFSGAVRHGSSGSPVLDDHGSVVGVVTAKLDLQKVYQNTGIRLDLVNDVGIAIPNAAVFDFLGANQLAFQSTTHATARSQKQVLEDARHFVREIGCWK